MRGEREKIKTNSSLYRKRWKGNTHPINVVWKGHEWFLNKQAQAARLHLCTFCAACFEERLWPGCADAKAELNGGQLPTEHFLEKSTRAFFSLCKPPIMKAQLFSGFLECFTYLHVSLWARNAEAQHSPSVSLCFQKRVDSGIHWILISISVPKLHLLIISFH